MSHRIQHIISNLSEAADKLFINLADEGPGLGSNSKRRTRTVEYLYAKYRSQLDTFDPGLSINLYEYYFYILDDIQKAYYSHLLNKPILTAETPIILRRLALDLSVFIKDNDFSCIYEYSEYEFVEGFDEMGTPITTSLFDEENPIMHTAGSLSISSKLTIIMDIIALFLAENIMPTMPQVVLKPQRDQTGILTGKANEQNTFENIIDGDLFLVLKHYYPDVNINKFKTSLFRYIEDQYFDGYTIGKFQTITKHKRVILEVFNQTADKILKIKRILYLKKSIGEYISKVFTDSGEPGALTSEMQKKQSPEVGVELLKITTVK